MKKTTTKRPAAAIAFDKLKTKAEKRVAIAKDVIAQLNAKTLKATTGSFVTFDEKLHSTLAYDQIPSDAYPTLRAAVHASPTCEVCALGSLLISQVKLNGDCQLAALEGDGWSPGDIIPIGRGKTFAPFLRRYFTPKQLQLIEIAYEQGRGAFDVGFEAKNESDDNWATIERGYSLAITRAEVTRAIDAFHQFSTPQLRLEAIMLNIIANKGEFVV